MPPQVASITYRGLEFRRQTRGQGAFRSLLKPLMGKAGSGQGRPIDYELPPEIPFLLKTGIKPKDLTPDQRLCLDWLRSGALHCDFEQARLFGQELDSRADLLEVSRELVDRFGYRAARDRLLELAPLQDNTDGKLEARMIQATRDQRFRVPDSLLELSREKRARVGFFFALAYGHKMGDTTPIVRYAAQRIREQGFQVFIFDTTSDGSSDLNGELIVRQLGEQLDKVDAAILMSSSKGTQDIAYGLLRHSELLSTEKLQKIRSVVSVSGVIRHSEQANWLNRSDSYRAKLVRLVMSIVGFETLDGLRTLGEDPWKGARTDHLSHLFWISFAMFPHLDDGWPTSEGQVHDIQRSMLHDGVRLGVNDSLVETAASFLPPGTGIRQGLVRVLGEHGMLQGRYLDGSPVSPTVAREGVKAKVISGYEVLETLLRAAHASELIGPS